MPTDDFEKVLTQARNAYEANTARQAQFAAAELMDMIGYRSDAKKWSAVGDDMALLVEHFGVEIQFRFVAPGFFYITIGDMDAHRVSSAADFGDLLTNYRTGLPGSPGIS